MNYTPKTEAELAKESLLSEGVYDFEVIETRDTPSKKGNDMITLKLCVFDIDGSQRHIFDYIALGTNFGERKLRRAANACGLIDIYNSGDLRDTTFLNTTGQISVRQQEGTTDFPLPKNVVSDYLPKDEGITEKPVRPAREVIDDEIPF